jgi:hypothetical protein
VPRGGWWHRCSKSWTWNNANPLTASHIVGVAPSGATSGDACELEVTRTWYVQQPGGEQVFKFTVKNVGGIACQGDIQLAMSTSASSSWSTGTLAAGASKSWVWNKREPARPDLRAGPVAARVVGAHRLPARGDAVLLPPGDQLGRERRAGVPPHRQEHRLPGPWPVLERSFSTTWTDRIEIGPETLRLEIDGRRLARLTIAEIARSAARKAFVTQ